DVVDVGTPGLQAVVRRFGDGVLTPDRALNRSRLGAIIFGDARARHDLDAIIHPLVWKASDELEDRAPADAVVVHDVPLLVETGQQDDFDLVVVVDVPEPLQLRRLIARNRLSRQQALARIGAQASRAERLAAADVVIDNSGSLDATRTQVDTLWRRLTGDGH
ncbi:MAG: dephospho-CoA kinase, partial [Propionibacterium freudenreichii]